MKAIAHLVAPATSMFALFCCLAGTGGCGGGNADDEATDASSTTPDSAIAHPDAPSAAIDARWPDGATPCNGTGDPLSPAEEDLVWLPADSWWAAPSTHLADVCATTQCAGVINAWSGAAYDSTHNQLLLWGGGHADYAGNEVYAFDVATLGWSRLTDPSPTEYQNLDPLPDGQPVSRHTYGGLAWIEHAERLLAHGGARWIDGGGTNVTWLFDPIAKSWENRSPGQSPNGGPSHGGAYDRVSQRVFLHATGALHAYDYDLDQWEQVADFGYPPYWPRYEIWGDKTLVVANDHRLLFGFGRGLYMVYEIDEDSFVTGDWVTTGGSTFDNSDVVGDRPEQVIVTGGGEVITASAPGVAYDEATDALVAWPNQGPVWRLDLASKTWTSGADPGALATNRPSGGTFGRWRYLPRVNAFILVNAVNENVLFYKHTEACGP